MAPGLVGPDRGRAQGRASRGAELDRLCTRERHRLPHVHGDGARPVCRALLRLPARTDAESAFRRVPRMAKGRVPGLTTTGRIARGDLGEQIERLKREPGNDLIAFGGATFPRSSRAE